jgi:hypothetical protein
LRIVASSDPTRFPEDELLGERLSLADDVLQTGSSILIPDLSRLGIPDRGWCMFAGVPFLAGRQAVGAACIVDQRPHSLDAEDLSLLQAVGRRASALLSEERGTAPFWSASGWLTRPALELLASLELRRAARTVVSLTLIVFEARSDDWRRLLQENVRPRRSGIGSLGPERYGVWLARPGADAATSEEVGTVLQVLRAREDVRGIGIVTFDGTVVGVSMDHLFEMAEKACAHSAEGKMRSIEQLRIRHDAASDASHAVGAE